MSATTPIEWTDSTWNPVTGCTPVSEGCDHCYARTLLDRFRGTAGHYFEGGFDLQPRPDKLPLPLTWRRPRRIFVPSTSDLFHRDVPDEYVARVWAVMALARRHTFQVLTKRHDRMRSLLSSPAWVELMCEAVRWVFGEFDVPIPVEDVDAATSWVESTERRDEALPPLPNVWLGVSVETQRWADIRIPALLDTPAAVRWISAEPLLGPIDVGVGDPHAGHDSDNVNGHPHPLVCLDCSTHDHEVEYYRRDPGAVGIDWVVCGGESGPGARPIHPDWVRSLRDQCTTAGVPFLFKQWGDWAPESMCATERGAATALYIERDGSTRPAAFGARGDAVTIQRNGKHRTGRRLDGQVWDQYPAVAR